MSVIAPAVALYWDPIAVAAVKVMRSVADVNEELSSDWIFTVIVGVDVPEILHIWIAAYTFCAEVTAPSCCDVPFPVAVYVVSESFICVALTGMSADCDAVIENGVRSPTAPNKLYWYWVALKK